MVPAFPCSRCAVGQVHEEASLAHLDVYAKIWFCAVLDNCNWGQFLRKNLSLASLHTGFSGLRANEGKSLQFQLLESINIFHKVSRHCLKKQTPKATQFLHMSPLFKASFKGWNDFPTLISHTAGMRLFTYTSLPTSYPSVSASLHHVALAWGMGPVVLTPTRAL